MTHTLETLAPGVLAWLADQLSTSGTNLGVVIAEDGLTIVDAGVVPAQATPLVDALTTLTPLPIRRLVLTGSHVELVGGSAAFPLAAVYGSAQTSAHLDQPPNPEVWKKLHPELDDDFDELLTRPVTHTVAEPAHLCPASIAVPIGGPQFENLIVQVPGANVVFAGPLLSLGVVPLGFDADFPVWIRSLEAVSGYGEIFVPSHGSICGVEELDIFAGYLQACLDANGVVSALADGPWNQWVGQDRHVVNVERAAMLRNGDASPPPSLLTMLGR